jgi:hypothetical protein
MILRHGFMAALVALPLWALACADDDRPSYELTCNEVTCLDVTVREEELDPNTTNVIRCEWRCESGFDSEWVAQFTRDPGEACWRLHFFEEGEGC